MRSILLTQYAQVLPSDLGLLELCDVVNERDEVIGRQQRNVCHTRGLRHRATYCLVFDTENRLLLQQRSDKYVSGCHILNTGSLLSLVDRAKQLRIAHRKLLGGGQWDVSLAEHVLPGETYLEVFISALLFSTISQSKDRLSTRESLDCYQILVCF